MWNVWFLIEHLLVDLYLIKSVAPICCQWNFLCTFNQERRTSFKTHHHFCVLHMFAIFVGKQTARQRFCIVHKPETECEISSVLTLLILSVQRKCLCTDTDPVIKIFRQSKQTCPPGSAAHLQQNNVAHQTTNMTN